MSAYACVLATALILSCSRPTGDFYGKIAYDGLDRSYYLHVPAVYSRGGKAALVIALHFYGGTGEEMAMVTGLNTTSDNSGFIVLYPDADGASWKDSDKRFVEALIDDVSSNYSIDDNKVFVTGYSNGAALAHLLACESEMIAAAAPVAGGLMYTDFTDLAPDKPVSTIHFHARDDSIFPYEGDEYSPPVEAMVSAWAVAQGCDPAPDSFYDYHGALRQTWSRSDGTCDVVLWTTDGGVHGWPSTSSPHRLPANDLIWEFFDNHPLK